MITRSQKRFANDCEVAKTSMTKDKTKTAKMDIQAPIVVHNDETKNVQLPVFNIHVHVPSMTPDSDKSYQFQPVIHLHFGDLVNKLSSSTTLEKVESIDKKSELKISSEENCNFDEQSNSYKNVALMSVKKNNTHKKLTISRSKKSSANLKTENSEAVLNSIAKIEENPETSRNSFCKRQAPARRSIRLANNRKLIKRLKELSGSESLTKETKREKSCENIKIENQSSSLEKTFNLKEPMVVLYDISKILKEENVSFCDDMICDKQKDSFDPVNVNVWENGSLEKYEKHSSDLLGEIKNEQNSVGSEENEKNLEKTTNDQDAIPVSKKFGEIYSYVYSSNSETNTKNNNNNTDFGGKSTFSDNTETNLENSVDPEKSFCKAQHNMEIIFVKDAENNQVIDNVLLQLEEDRMIEIGNNLSNVLSKDKDQLSNLKSSDIKNNTTVSLNLESKDSSSSSDNEFHLDDPASSLFQTTTSEEGIHQSASLRVLNTEKLNVCLESKNNNMLENIEENALSSSELDDCKEVNENTLDFQLELIKKEMKKRDMIVKEGSGRTKSLKKETASQVTKEMPEKPSEKKKKKLSKKMTKSMPVANGAEKLPLAVDYIPLQASGPTKFSIAQLSNVKPYGSHKAKNFKSEMLFGKRVNRYSNPKQLQIYLLKKQAAKIRNK